MSYRDDDRREPPLPKPYGFVPLPQGAIPTEPPQGHHRYAPRLLSGTLTATITARSPVHVASGLLEQNPKDRTYPMFKAHFRTQGQLAIPGTSLKGCIRSIVEAITRSFVTTTKADLPRSLQATQQLDRLDIASRIFGTLGFQGCVQFTDAVLSAGRAEIVPSVQLFRPRQEARDTYYAGSLPHGRKFYMHGQLAKGDLPLEACAIGSQFGLRMHFENLQDAELGLVLVALGQGTPSFCPKLGGAKPACLGTIQIADVHVEALDLQSSYTSFDVATTSLDVASLLGAAAPLILTTQLGALVELLQWPREDRRCPDRSY